MHSPSSRAIEFAGFVLSHCATIADDHRKGELICPFAVLCDSEGVLRVLPFEAATQADAVEKGWASLPEAQAEGEWWGFGREGLVPTQDGPVDALIVSVWTPEDEDLFSILQRFGRADDAGLCFVGSPELHIGGRDAAQPQDAWDLQSLLRGVGQHAGGAKWEEWRSRSRSLK